MMYPTLLRFVGMFDPSGVIVFYESLILQVFDPDGVK
jgi:hypothetical protein